MPDRAFREEIDVRQVVPAVFVFTVTSHRDLDVEQTAGGHRTPHLRHFTHWIDHMFQGVTTQNEIECHCVWNVTCHPTQVTHALYKIPLAVVHHEAAVASHKALQVVTGCPADVHDPQVIQLSEAAEACIYVPGPFVVIDGISLLSFSYLSVSQLVHHGVLDSHIFLFWARVEKDEAAISAYQKGKLHRTPTTQYSLEQDIVSNIVYIQEIAIEVIARMGYLSCAQLFKLLSPTDGTGTNDPHLSPHLSSVHRTLALLHCH